ncbi:TonB-dependent receptor [Gramella sp. GC03-9]|uniref:TonB-dependent receptor n=1 Tax=Christiangramia oceanisediminis TaxID=2920386 RepID=A0A9X2R847_9FLAO|nr:TonB-dependent receptor [Gramella oceanisediminis]MCP9200123.1 TonB-dependent receptor [Gramella oceanisediminis]
MKNILFYTLFVIGFCPVLKAQTDITVLDTVLLSDEKLLEFSTGQQVHKLSDSLIRNNDPLLTDILNFNSPVYFKENGRGMVSSPSFRGTTASQTAVVWNGININSQFNGQLDFNTINSGAYDEIAIRGGGGSVVYGTGAIGGSVHLNNIISFRERTEHHLVFRYGSFNTIDARYQLELSKNDWSFNLSLARNSSDNDYEYPEDRGENLNGQYYNNAINLSLGHRFHLNNTIKLISELFEGERHFSLIRPSEPRTRYTNLNSRNLLEWNSEFSDFDQVTTLAYITENYRYYANIESDVYSLGVAKNLIAKYDLSYEAGENILINTVLQNTYIDGEGSDLGSNSRNIFSAAFLFKQALSDKFQYEAGLRKEITQNYESPVLFSLGANYEFNDIYSLQLSASKNFRIPTYNDLYWTNSGNPELDPETSIQGEIGNRFSLRDLDVELVLFYNELQQMIRWLPGENGVWRPRNEDEVQIMGIESRVSWEKLFEDNQQLNVQASFAYTSSQDRDTGRQLIYVPFYKVTGTAGYTWKRFTPSLQLLYNAKVFTRTDHSESLDGYVLANFSASYAMDEKRQWIAGARINNLLNSDYQNVEDRFMPGTNFNIFLNINL